MAEFHTPMEEAPATFPPTVQEPPAGDPVRTTATEAMLPESRPEAIAAAANEPAVSQKHADTALPQHEDNKLGSEQVMVQTEPASEGLLGYKAPGLVKSLRFSKKFFWFGDEAIAVTDLHQYLRGEKPEVAHHNASWSSQTGKGLLYFSKSATHKGQPAGIINLTDISEVTREGINEFHFKLHNQKHTFQAASLDERDRWLVAIQTRAAEAKTTSENIIGSAGYKENFGKLGGSSTPLAPIAPTIAPTNEETSSTRNQGDTTVVVPRNDTAAPSATAVSDGDRATKRKQKSRSVSRKRGSIFGSLLGKKDEHDETKDLKKEEKTEEKAEKREEKKLEKKEKKAVKEDNTVEGEGPWTDPPAPKVSHADLNHGEPAPIDAAAIAARVIDAPVVGADEIKPVIPDHTTTSTTTEQAVGNNIVTPTRETTVEAAPKTSKRNSLFGGLFQKKEVASPSEEKSERDVAPAVPAKDVPAKDAEGLAVSSTRKDPSSPEGIANEPVAPAAVSHNAPRASSPPRESFFGGLFSKQKDGKLQENKNGSVEKPTSTPETAPVIPSAAQSAAPTVGQPETAEAAAPLTNSAIATTSKPDTKDILTPTSETTVTAANAEPIKEKRRSSFFTNLGSKREKKVESDPEVVDAEIKPKSASPLPKLGGIFRNPSRAMRGGKDSTKKEPISPPTTKATTHTADAETKASDTPIEAPGESSAAEVVKENTHSGTDTVGSRTNNVVSEPQPLNQTHEATTSVSAAA